MFKLTRRGLGRAGVAFASAALGQGALGGVAAQTQGRSPVVDPDSLIDPELRPMASTIAQMEAAEPPPSLKAMIAERGTPSPVLPKPAATPAFHAQMIPGPKGAPDVRVYVINAKAGMRRPAILHMHGGGYVYEAALDYVGMLQQTAAALDCVIVTVDYRLAPEAPYPGALEDNYAALRWTFDNAETLGVDRKRVALMGESAGGGHAAALAIAVRDRKEFRVRLQVLLYPMIDDRTGAEGPIPSHIGAFLWTPAHNQIGWRALLGTSAGGPSTPGTAAAAREVDLAGLAPAFIAVGAIDLFVDEDIAYARRLVQSGVPTELVVVPGGYHAFDMVTPDAAVSKAFTSAKLSALRRAFAL